MECKFNIGDTVVCIEGDEVKLKANDLHFGRKYVVEDIEEDFGTPGEFIVHLQGLGNGGVSQKN